MLRKFMIFSAFLIPLAAQAAVREAIVEVPAADVWSEPPKHPEKMSGDQRETQLLYGERVRIVETRGNVVRIEALEQPEYSHDKKWEGYPGWVEAIALKPAPDIKQAPSIVLSTWTSTMQPETMPDFYLPFGSFIRPGGKARDLYVIATPQGDRCLAMGSTRSLPKEVKSIYREGLLQTARRFLGVPYLWGGLTAGPSPDQPVISKTIKFGVDCSGFVHVLFRAYGLTVPRDAHEQWMKAAPIKRNDLLPADLIFSAKADKPKKITHVAFYAGDNQIIEAPQTGLNVRQISFQEKYGVDLNQAETGERVGDRVIYFGRFIND